MMDARSLATGLLMALSIVRSGRLVLAEATAQAGVGTLPRKRRTPSGRAYGFGFSEGYGQVTVDGRTGYIDKTGKVVIKPQFEFAGRFREGLAVVSITGKRGFVDKAAKILLQPRYDDARDFREGLAAVKLKGRWGFLNKRGEWVIPRSYDHISLGFSRGRAPVEVRERWAYVDRAGRMVTRAIYEQALPFRNRLAAVCRDGKYGFIDRGFGQ